MEKESTAVFGFGRTNPPTTGHQKLLNKIGEVATAHGGAGHFVASHSEGTSKDPIPQSKKIQYLKKIAPKNVDVSGSSKESPTFLQAAKKLHEAGHKHLVMVAGSDRVDEFKKKLDQYNGKEGHYNFKSIKVVSAGNRDPDAEGTEGVSGTKMREHARSGNEKAFKSGLPKELHPHTREIMDHIRAIKEEVLSEAEQLKELVMVKRNKKVLLNKDLDVVVIDPETKPVVKEQAIAETKKLSAAMKLFAALKRLEDRRAAQPPRLPGETPQWLKDAAKRRADQNEEVQIDEVLSVQQRRRKAVMIRRHSAKMKKARMMAMKRTAPNKNITRRSQNQARKAMRKRVAGKLGTRYSSLSPSSKMAIDRLLSKKKKNVAAIAKKIRPFIKQVDAKRLSSGKKRVSYSNRPIYASYQFLDNNLMSIAEHAYEYYKEKQSGI